MNRLVVHPFRLLLLALLPLVTHAAPPPYWPGYPPPPQYYYPPLPTAPAKSEVAPSTQPEAVTPEPAVEDDTSAKIKAPASTEVMPSIKPETITPEIADTSTKVTAPASTEDETSERDTLDVGTNEPVKVEITALPPRNEKNEKSEEAALAAQCREENAENYEADISAEASSSYDDKIDTALAQEIASAIQQGNFAEAYYQWRPRAEAGNTDAQYGIGWMYHNGYGLAIDDDEAMAWWELASRQGHIDATFALGMLHGLGEGAVRRDMALAVSYYHQAAREGHEDARLLLRILMAEGDSSANQLLQTLLSEGRLEEIATPAAVISAKANVRKGPGTDHKVRTTLSQGNTLLPLKRQGRWLLVGIEGKSFIGWIHDSLVGKDILPN